MLQDINDNKMLFGGKVIVFGGDFRQVLPIVPRARKEEIINSCLIMSHLWPLLEKIKLIENIRAMHDPLFADFLIRIGDGIEEKNDEDNIKLPLNMIIPYEDEEISLQKLINIIFTDINDYSNNVDTMMNQPKKKNEYVDQINNLLIEKFPGDPVKYYSFDETIDETKQCFQEDFLNTLSLSGIPPHELVLKKNCPIMLICNINPSEGLCDGTRLICRNFQPNVIDAKITTGYYRGKRVFLPRILLLPFENTKNPFPFKRSQFPVHLSFAMTINKAQ